MSEMKRTLEMINRMQADGVINKYAIGGAVGATFYLEPAATLDVDIFVVLPQISSSSLITVTPLYDYLTSRGCSIEHEHVIVEGWPVQFLPVGDDLEREALRDAVQTEVEGVSTWVMRPEHLVALALRTGRTKDFARIIQFLEAGVVNSEALDSVITRNGLVTQWQRFRGRFLEQ